MKTRNSHGLLQLGREVLAYCQCLYRENKALFVSVDLIGEKNQVILEYRIVNGAYVWVCVSVFFPRIEPVGKPYREVCLRSELWNWMAHQPNSWSKHQGTRIEQVLAYCRDEQKYVGRSM